MKKITANEFYAMIDENPSVFEYGDTPLEITEFVHCNNFPITHLSKHLTFSGKDGDGWAADFAFCKNLKNASGTFHSFVRFTNSAIERIETLNILHAKKDGEAVNFDSCQNLEIATGTYPGYASFENSGIHSIHNLHISNPDIDGIYANFENCRNLKNLQGWNLSKEIWIEPEKLAAEKERRALQKFLKETNPKELPFL
jgi:hypothetical protein